MTAPDGEWHRLRPGARLPHGISDKLTLAFKSSELRWGESQARTCIWVQTTVAQLRKLVGAAVAHQNDKSFDLDDLCLAQFVAAEQADGGSALDEAQQWLTRQSVDKRPARVLAEVVRLIINGGLPAAHLVVSCPDRQGAGSNDTLAKWWVPGEGQDQPTVIGKFRQDGHLVDLKVLRWSRTSDEMCDKQLRLQKDVATRRTVDVQESAAVAKQLVNSLLATAVGVVLLILMSRSLSWVALYKRPVCLKWLLSFKWRLGVRRPWHLKALFHVLWCTIVGLLCSERVAKRYNDEKYAAARQDAEALLLA